MLNAVKFLPAVNGLTFNAVKLQNSFLYSFVRSLSRNVVKFLYILFREISRKSLENFAKCEIKISQNISRNFARHPNGVRVGCLRYLLRSKYKRILKRIFIRFEANKRVRFALIRFEANIEGNIYSLRSE